jgi:hypothetical protein
VKESATKLQPSLFKWASNVVTGLGSRSKTLVSRVMTVNSNSSIASEADFEAITKDKDSWTQTFEFTDTIDDSSSIRGLNKPVWRQTVLVDTGELIESTPWPPAQVTKIPDGPRDIKQLFGMDNCRSGHSLKLREIFLKASRWQLQYSS